jgi:NAD(P)-dependent dehydrogenase (short-subunit alcohol dehydrogenase family)
VTETTSGVALVTSRVALVTGCSTGVGLATAIRLASEGWRVVSTVRRLDAAEDLHAAAATAGGTIDIRGCDVRDAAAVDACVAGVVADHGRLDAVVNNAGIGHAGTLEHDGVNVVRAVMETNFFGVVNVTHAAIPHLRASSGRLVAVTSVAGAVGQPFNEAYCASKHAVEGFYESLAPVLHELGVAVIIVEPGPVASPFLAKGLPATREAVPDDPYARMLQAYIDVVTGASADAQDAGAVAEVILRALTDPDPAPRQQTSPLAAAIIGKKLADLDGRAIQRMTSRWIQPQEP